MPARPLRNSPARPAHVGAAPSPSPAPGALHALSWLAAALPYAVRLTALAGVYVLVAKLGLSLAGTHGSVSLVWPPTGIALAALLRGGYRFWPAIAAGAFATNATTDASLLTAAGIAVGNTLEALVGAYLLDRVAAFRRSLDRLRDVLGLVGLGAGVACACSATIGVASLCLGGAARWGAFGSLWWQWWLGDAMGALVVAPVLLTWMPPPPWTATSRPRLLEAGALLASLATAGWVVFGGWLTRQPLAYPLAFAVFPFVIWAALRFGPRGAAGATLVAAGMAVWGTVRDVGPFAGETLTESLLLQQTFIGVVAVTTLVLGALTAQRERAEAALVGSEQRYRDLVENATDLVYTLDLAGRFTSVNAGGERFLGYRRSEVLGRSFVDTVVAPPYRELARVMLARQTVDSTPVVYGLDLAARGGRLVSVEVSTRLMTREGMSAGVQGIARDVTERKKAEAALEAANWKLTGWVSELEDRTRQITLLGEMGELLQSCRLAHEAYTVVAQFATRLFPGDSGLLGVIQGSRHLVDVAAAWGPSPPGERSFAPDQCWAIRRGRLHVVDGPDSAPPCPHADGARGAGYLCVPMMAQGEPLGVFHLQRRPPEAPGRQPAPRASREPDHRLVVTVAEHIALALANLRLQETLRSEAIRDSLTGLFNRRYMEESLDREMRRAARAGTPLGIIMLDIDHFKRFNDTYGHEAGDTLLAALGALLRAQVRAEDIACRYGGEEFTLILPEALPAATRDRAEEIRARVARLEVPYRGSLLEPVTVSLGVAGFPRHGAGGRDVLFAADVALYRAKREGRDRVVVAE